MKIAIRQFAGIVPKLNPRYLPETQAQNAVNCPLYNGSLQPLLDVSGILAIADSNGVPETIFRYGMDKASDTELWLAWNNWVNVVRSPIAGDEKGRIYFTGNGDKPQATDKALLAAAVQDYDIEVSGKHYPAHLFGGAGSTIPSRPIGLPVPTFTPKVYVTTAPTNMSNDSTETRVYCYTWVNDWGEESLPSLPSDPLDVKYGQGVVIYNMDTMPLNNPWHLAKRRIYRSTDGTFLFVAEIAGADENYTDTLQAAALGEPLPSAQWEPPPANLRGLVAMPNGVLAGFVGRDVYLSEPYRPFAWPSAYMQTMDYNVIGLGVIDTTLVVLTNGEPAFIQGSHPESMVVVKTALEQACVSRKSIVSMGGAVWYASPDGLVMLAPNGSRVVTESMMTRAQWQSLNPSGMIAFHHDGRYICFTGITTGDYDPVNTVGLGIPGVGATQKPTGNNGQPYIKLDATGNSQAVITITGKATFKPASQSTFDSDFDSVVILLPFSELITTTDASGATVTCTPDYGFAKSIVSCQGDTANWMHPNVGKWGGYAGKVTHNAGGTYFPKTQPHSKRFVNDSLPSLFNGNGKSHFTIEGWFYVPTDLTATATQTTTATGTATGNAVIPANGIAVSQDVDYQNQWYGQEPGIAGICLYVYQDRDNSGVSQWWTVDLSGDVAAYPTQDLGRYYKDLFMGDGSILLPFLPNQPVIVKPQTTTTTANVNVTSNGLGAPVPWKANLFMMSGLELFVGAANQLMVLGSAPNSWLYTVDNAFVTGVWTFVQLLRDDTIGLRIAVNGVEVEWLTHWGPQNFRSGYGYCDMKPNSNGLQFFNNRGFIDVSLCGVCDFRVSNIVRPIGLPAAPFPTGFQPPTVDRYFNNVTLLAHFSGSLTDSSNAHNVINLNGTAQLTNQRSKFGNGALLCNQATGGVTVPGNSGFDLTQGAWTVEAFYYGDVSQQTYICYQGGVSYQNFAQFGITPGFNTAAFEYGTSDSAHFASSWSQWGGKRVTDPSKLGQWNHVAMTCDGATVRLYINGDFVDETPKHPAMSCDVSRPLAIGICLGGQALYINEVRITKGVSRYSKGFRIPEAPFPDVAG